MSSYKKLTCDNYYGNLYTIIFTLSSGESIKLEPWDYTYNKLVTNYQGELVY